MCRIFHVLDYFGVLGYLSTYLVTSLVTFSHHFLLILWSPGRLTTLVVAGAAPVQDDPTGSLGCGPETPSVPWKPKLRSHENWLSWESFSLNYFGSGGDDDDDDDDEYCSS